MNKAEKDQNLRDRGRNFRAVSDATRETNFRQGRIEDSFGMNPFIRESLELARSGNLVKSQNDAANLSSANQLELAARQGNRGGTNAAQIERINQQNLVKAQDMQQQNLNTALTAASANKDSLTRAKRQFDENRLNLADTKLAAAQENYATAIDNEASRPYRFGAEMLSTFGDIFGGGAGVATAAKGMRLPGEFSHETNPIDIYRNGKKIAEATGEETLYVINDKQKAKAMAQGGYIASLLRNLDKNSA